MKIFWRFVRRWWWALLMGVATVLGAVASVLLRPKPDIGRGLGYVQKKPFKEGAAEKIERIRLEGEVERARVKVRAQIEGDELDEIERIGENNPSEGRRRLATWLSQNL